MSDNITNQLNYLNETKQMLKQAIIDKGQELDDATPFRNYVEKVSAIETGVDTSDATATPEDLISPKTAYVNGEKITGSIIPTYDSLEIGNVDINNIPVDILNYVITDIKLKDSICIGLSGEKEVIISKVLNNRVINDNKLVISLTQLGITSTTALIRDVKFSEKLNTGDYVIWVAAKEPSPHRANVKVYVSCLKYNPTTHTIYSDYLQTTNFQSGYYCTGHPECEHITIFPFEFKGIQKCMWFLNTREQLNGKGITSYNTFTLSSPDLTLSRVAGAAFNLEATSHNGCYREGAIMIQKIGNTVLLLVPYNQLVSYNDPYMWSAVTLLNNSGDITSSHILTPQKNRNMFLVSEQVAYINGAYYNISNINVPLAQSTITLSGNEMGIYYDGFIYVFRPTTSTVSIYSFSLNTYKETFVRSQSIDWFNTDTTLKKLGILPYVTSDGLMYASTLSRVGPYTGRNNAVLHDYYTLTLSLANAGNGQKYLYSLGTEMGTLYNPIKSNVISSDILSGKLAYNTGGLVVGTMPNNGTLSYIPRAISQSIPLGYTNGGTIAGDSNLISSSIRADKSIFGIVGSAPITFATIEELEANTNFPEDTFAIVYGTSYVGTYRLDKGSWTQIGDSSQNQQIMDVLNDVANSTDQYEGNGGTDEEINKVIEKIMGSLIQDGLVTHFSLNNNLIDSISGTEATTNGMNFAYDSNIDRYVLAPSNNYNVIFSVPDISLNNFTISIQAKSLGNTDSHAFMFGLAGGTADSSCVLKGHDGVLSIERYYGEIDTTYNVNTDNLWHRYTMTVENSTQLKVYVDDNLVFSQEGTYQFSPTRGIIGNNPGFGHIWNGYLASALIYNRPLNQAEIASMTNIYN